MVLQAQACGRVGRCRGFEGSLARVGLLLFSGCPRGFTRPRPRHRLTPPRVSLFVVSTPGAGPSRAHPPPANRGLVGPRGRSGPTRGRSNQIPRSSVRCQERLEPGTRSIEPPRVANSTRPSARAGRAWSGASSDGAFDARAAYVKQIPADRNKVPKSTLKSTIPMGPPAGADAGSAAGPAAGSAGPAAGSAGPAAGSAGPAAGPAAGSAGPAAGSAGPAAGSAGPAAGSAGPAAGSAGPAAGSAGPAAGSAGPAAGSAGPAAGSAGPAAGPAGPAGPAAGSAGPAAGSAASAH